MVMGERTCFLEFCPTCELQVAPDDEHCPECVAVLDGEA